MFKALLLSGLLLLPLVGCARADDQPDAKQSAATAAPQLSPELKTFFRHLRDGEKQTVVVYGTSLTAIGGWTGAMKSWFDKRFPGQVSFINSGMRGKNSDEGVTHLKSKVMDYEPKLVFIEFAINDARIDPVTGQKLTLKKAASNLDTMVQTIHKQNPNSAIVLQVMNPTWDAPNEKHSASGRPDYDAYNDVYRRYARDHSLPLIDHWNSWLKLRDDNLETFKSYIPDGTHPTDEASIRITWPLIQATLEAAAGDS